MNLLQYRIKTLYKYQDLIKELVGRDLKLKYRRSFLGYVWSILNPLLTMIVLTIVFSELLGKKQSPSPYLRDGVNPHIWVDGEKAEWYGFKPSAQDYSQMRDAAEDYIEVFREPELNESQGMSMQM